jgi:hypothetical protein
MDRKTQFERARNKKLKARPGGFSIDLVQPRGLAQKGKIEKFPNRQCNYRIGGKELLIRKNRKNPKRDQAPFYFIPLVVGGKRCAANELTRGRCLEHIASTYERNDD